MYLIVDILLNLGFFFYRLFIFDALCECQGHSLGGNRAHCCLCLVIVGMFVLFPGSRIQRHIICCELIAGRILTVYLLGNNQIGIQFRTSQTISLHQLINPGKITRLGRIQSLAVVVRIRKGEYRNNAAVFLYIG